MLLNTGLTDTTFDIFLIFSRVLTGALTVKPFSTVLLVIYIVSSVLQGSLELFLAGFLAASSAYVLELLFYVTGMIRTGRNCAGRPHSSGAQERQRQKIAA